MMGKAHAIQDGGQATSPEQDGRVDTVGLRLLVDLVGLTDQGRFGAHQQPLGSEEWWWTRKQTALNGRDQSDGVHGNGEDGEKDVAGNGGGCLCDVWC